MSKKLSALVAIFFSFSVFFASGIQAYAAMESGDGGGGGPAATGSLCPKNVDASGAKYSALCNGIDDPGALIGKVITIIFIVVTIVALFYLIWGGFKWLTSGGDAKAVETARGHIIAAIIGLVIVFLSYFILNFVIRIFIPDFSIAKFTIPAVFNN